MCALQGPLLHWRRAVCFICSPTELSVSSSRLPTQAPDRGEVSEALTSAQNVREPLKSQSSRYILF